MQPASLLFDFEEPSSVGNCLTIGGIAGLALATKVDRRPFFPRPDFRADADGLAAVKRPAKVTGAFGSALRWWAGDHDSDLSSRASAQYTHTTRTTE
jgi:hypothetical protein